MEQSTNFIKPNPRNVCEVIVPADVCVGCGVCAGVCPVEALHIEFNRFGEYVPVEIETRCTACGLCLKVCPFWNGNENEVQLAEGSFASVAGISSRLETGYFLDSFVGYVLHEEYRVARTSGGLATWLQQAYLEKNLADYVVSVIPTGTFDPFFKFSVLRSTKAVRSSAKSTYYPVEMTEVVRTILKVEGRYLVIAQPCFLKAMRLAMQQDKRLRKRIVGLLGIVCGGAKSCFLAEYILAKAKIDISEGGYLDFRYKDPARSARDYGFLFALDKRGQAYVNPLICCYSMLKLVWQRNYFTPQACDFCDDLFAEVADVAFMDAWLPQYDQDWRGTSIALIRSPKVLELFREGRQDQELELEEIDIASVIQSQRGGMLNKRDYLAHRLYLASKHRQAYTPVKRVSPRKLDALFDRWLLWCKDRMRVLSRKKFAELVRSLPATSVDHFDAQMSSIVFLYRVVRFLRRQWRKLAK